MGEAGRLAGYDTVSTSLALCGDAELRELVDAAVPLGTGIGGKSARMDVAGTTVFVKRVPLTDLERRPEHLRSTANVFELPAFCQYGVGGPGFGAWREVAVHTMTTNWVLSGQFQGFPLTYHWRVLPDEAPTLAEELAHFENVLTDGRRLYFADYGLALSSRFDLSPTETDFYDRHAGYDRCYTASYLVNWLVTALYGADWETRGALIRAWAEGQQPTGAPPGTARILARHAPVAAVMTDFYRTIQEVSRTTSYPAERLRRFCP
ncbi:hypothetical protein [Streptomyces coeruleorubidus]|uniref:hypothetical protein n=1 Tax=Streptomyces coeruleorubidus TaxID=116188 RepID=UPI00379A05A2